jgi:hypothetical protein
MASLSITYTPQYEGCHRIAVRGDAISPTPPFCVYIDSSASVIGVQKTTVITIDETFDECLPVEPVLCANYTVDGYIQPCCAAEDDIPSRVTFKFGTETNTCDVYEISCTKSGIANIVVDYAGSGYVSPPSVIITPTGGGTGFLGTVVLDGDSVDSVNITANGENYTTAAAVRFGLSPTGDDATGYIEFCPCGTNCGVNSILSYDDCVNQAEEQVATPFTGSSYRVCSQSLPTVTNSTSTIIQKIASEACCSCQNYTIANGEKERSLPIDYIDCNNVRQSATILPLATLTVCMVPGSLHLVKDYIVTVTNLGNCS